MRLGLGIGLGLSGAPAVGWSPAKLAALFAWYRGDTVALDGSNKVQTWTDKSVNGYDATQASAGNRPGYVANGGLGYLSLTGAESVVAATMPGHAQPVEIFAVVRPADAAPAGPEMLIDNANVWLYQFGANTYAAAGGAGALGSALSVADHIVDAEINGAASVVNTDGTAGTPADAGALAWAASTTIGNFYDGSFSLGFVGRIYEVIVCSAILSAGDRASTIAYLKSRYSIA